MLQPRPSPVAPVEAMQTLVMTGGTSGFGRRMVEQLLAGKPEWRILLIARPSERAASLAQVPGADGRLEIIPADLADLASVARAASAVRLRLGARGIDALVMNAGVQAVLRDEASKDGLELAFAVNHLAHFLLVETLLPSVRKGGRIVLTSSEVHDPAAFCLMGITRAAWEDPQLMADPDRAQSQYTSPVDRGESRYCASKLLNLMYARHLARTTQDVICCAFNPSVVPGTEIARERNFLQVLGWKYIMPILAPILPGARSMAHSAGDLIWIATEADGAAIHGQFVDGRVVQPGSEESRDDAKIARVIEVSRHILAQKLPSIAA